MDNYLSELTTEEVNKDTQNIDECNTEEMLILINEQDSIIHEAVKKQIPNISLGVDIIYNSLKSGGRMFYIGAGTSGRLGVLDASECPPTFGTDPQLVQAYIAGGDSALRTSSEGCEDDSEAGVKLVQDCKITSKDVVVGITASGGAAFVLAAIKESNEIGAATIGLVNNNNSKLSKICDVCIAPIVGAEVIIGSTRMKSGTSQKLVLNMLTTCTMVKLGKVYGNLMVDLKATNKKLYERARHIVCLATGVDDITALQYLELSNRNAKLAIMMIKTGLNVNGAKSILEKHDGKLKDSIKAATA
ncbi:N-acetylmuramic acid 6-phosphate etherase [Clostridium bowmanii]|uniref:N-acetylmuramic acid 6-phosphate etherase n=1 Tax=Clostridium bowmanii TaxID=132925 RepID=UPI001C0E282E|nr:N-acetylmuramic acid 6-phosphate etherase [Clostridium bowmanii]MBU3190217.1 N-acetylmuramic acid 6-phosphate etherase [Clostridium bowmanii]MCA1074808.1 N-acetylmuramic acid 6-phosphate etherase [Clostridium bowmanii]